MWRALVFGAFTVLCLGFLVYQVAPLTVEADERGVRRYSHGRLRIDLPWERVAWVAYGKWPLTFWSKLPEPNALTLLVQGHHMRQFVTFNDFSFRVTHDAMARFADTVVTMARERGIRVYPNPFGALGLGRP